MNDHDNQHDERPAPDQPPTSVLDAERATTAAAITSNRCAEWVASTVTPTDLWTFEYQIVIEAAFELAGSGQHVDPLAVLHHLTETKQLAQLRRSGPNLLTTLTQHAPAPHEAAVAHHAQIVVDDARRRRVRAACLSAAGYAADPDFDAADIDLIVTNIQAAAGLRATSDGPVFMDDTYDLLDNLTPGKTDTTGLTSPWADLDEKVTFQPGRMVAIGARPGSGKSLFGLNFAVHRALRHGEGVLFASMEMPRQEIFNRILSAEARVELDRFERRALADSDWERIAPVAERLQASRLDIDTEPHMTLAHIKARLRHMQTHCPPRVLVVDYVQLMTPSKRADRRDLEISEFTRGLKLLAGEFGVCVIALAQLNRGPEQRVNKRPQMSDLRESGSLENDADAVLLLHREPDEGDRQRVGELDVIVAKNRGGVSGVDVRLAWLAHRATLGNFAR